MRSIEYVFGGTPRNLDDCLDLALREKPINISLELTADETVTGTHIFKRLLARFTWKFPNGNIEYDEIYGGVFVHETEKRQKRSVDNANCRLESCLNKIEKSGADILGKEKSFDYSLIY